MRLRITVSTEVELSEQSAFATVEQYNDFKDDHETMYEIFSDEILDNVAHVENWKVEEIIPPPAPEATCATCFEPESCNWHHAYTSTDGDPIPRDHPFTPDHVDPFQQLLDVIRGVQIYLGTADADTAMMLEQLAAEIRKKTSSRASPGSTPDLPQKERTPHP